VGAKGIRRKSIPAKSTASSQYGRWWGIGRSAVIGNDAAPLCRQSHSAAHAPGPDRSGLVPEGCIPRPGIPRL
jgi:hypothetical protein